MRNCCLIVLPINILKFENFRVLHRVIWWLSPGDLVASLVFQVFVTSGNISRS
jgi:hypothetical protein